MRLALTALAVGFVGFAVPAQSCFSNPPTGILLGNTPDTIYPVQPIGFMFPFLGSLMTHIYVSDQGVVFPVPWIGFPPPPAGTPPSVGTLQTYPAIAPLWTDVVAGGTDAGVWLDNTTGLFCVVTWRNMHEYGNPANKFSMRLTLAITGEVLFEWSAGATNVATSRYFGEGITGLTPFGGTAWSSNLSAGGLIGSNATFEQWSVFGWTPNAFDLASSTLVLSPVSFAQWSVSPWFPPSQGPCAATTSYGAGCFGLSLASNNAPFIGNANYSLQTTGVPSLQPVAFLAFGDAAVVPGQDLGPIGMAGCFAHTNATFGAFSFAVAGGTGVFTLPIPATLSPNLLLTAQAVAFSNSTSIGYIASNGHQILIAY